MSLLSRIRNTFRRGSQNEIDEELQTHFDEARAAGRDAHDVTRAFGSRLRTRESVRDAITLPWLESLAADAVFGWRQLSKHKAASAVAILSLALGSGSAIAAFRLIDALLLRPLPVSEPERLFTLGYERVYEREKSVVTVFDYPGFRQFRQSARDQAELMAISPPRRINVTYGSEDATERISGQFVSGWTFGVFGLQPAAGRLLTESDDTGGARPVAVISYDYWSRRFGKDPAVIGRKVNLGAPFEIVGVAPRGFTGTEPGTFTDIFHPSIMNEQAIANPGWQWLRIWVQPRPGVGREALRQVLGQALLANHRERAKTFPPATPKQRVEQYISAPVVLAAAGRGISDWQHDYRLALFTLAGLVALVLLIACANVANLMTAQASTRAREMVLRVSIGAGRARLMQLVLMQGVITAVIASALGALFAWWAAPSVLSLINPADDPVRLAMPADGRIAAFGLVLTFGIALLFGLAPAIRAGMVRPAAALKGGDPHGRRRLMYALVAAQVFFCVLVQMTAGLFVNTFDRLVHQPLGFSPERVLTIEAVTKGEQPRNRWYQVVDHLRSLASVESASVAGFGLMSSNGWSQDVWANGHTPENMDAPWFLEVSPGWLDSMKMELRAGRDFRADEVYPRVAIVNQAFARVYFNGESPLGKTLDTTLFGKRVTASVVGLTGDARYDGMRAPIPPTIYVPFRRIGKSGDETNERFATFIVRTKGESGPLAGFLRAEIHRARSEFRVANIRSQEELVRAQTLRERLLATLSAFFAGVAVLLASIGLYGVLDYAVLARSRELCIRLSLGAKERDIVWRVTAAVVSMLALGATAGVAAGIASERMLAGLLFQVKSTEPSVLALPGVLILLAATLGATPRAARSADGPGRVIAVGIELAPLLCITIYLAIWSTQARTSKSGSRNCARESWNWSCSASCTASDTTATPWCARCPTADRHSKRERSIPFCLGWTAMG